MFLVVDFFMFKNIRYLCVCWIYISQFTLRSPYESSKTLNVYIYKDVSARTNVFSLQFPCTCISNIVHIRHKKHSYSEVPGTKEFDLSYTNLYLIRFISFAILDKMNETEFALSVNSLVTCMFVIWVHVIVFYYNSLCLFSPQVLDAR